MQSIDGAMPPQTAQLLQRARLGLSLQEEPFAEWGSGLGLSGEAVVEQLRDLLRSHVIGGVGLVWAAGAVNRLSEPADRTLQEATAWGLPLVQRPYEALGAMLGWPSARVCERLSAWLARGDLLRIGMLPAGVW